jgi:hypothetical protein
MGPEAARFYAAVVDRLLSHDGLLAMARRIADVCSRRTPAAPAGQGA